VNTVGVFAGRGDVILGMGMALLFGTFIGWQLHVWYMKAKDWKLWRK
jgi:hypothetical protein